MGDALDDLMGQAADADGLGRVDFRDRIAAYGAAAVKRLEPWLADPRLATFAVLTIAAASARGALPEAQRALRRARPRSVVQADIDRALRSIAGGGNFGSMNNMAGSLHRALDELRLLFEGWRARGSPPQRAIAWRQPDWMTAFPKHRERLHDLPPTLDRDAVRRIAADAIQGPDKAEFAFLVVKAWGEAGNGYGPSRALKSMKSTDQPGRRLLAAAEILRDRGTQAAYEAMSDGGPCRIFNVGPAFGTKYLFFSQPAALRPMALIHDKNVGDWLHGHAGFPPWSTAWRPKRYAAYVGQMHRWAASLDCVPDQVELCMFRSALGPTNQWQDG
jgi:hypothetical protein